jgi:hypothetical protein
LTDSFRPSSTTSCPRRLASSPVPELALRPADHCQGNRGGGPHSALGLTSRQHTRADEAARTVCVEVEARPPL